MSDPHLPPIISSKRATLRRKRERGSYDRSLVHAILDEGLICHVGFTDGDSTFVVPMIYARVGDSLYIHGAVANHTLRTLASGVEACITVTILDALVLARSAFHHSMNYRSVMLFGSGSVVDDDDEKRAVLLATLDHMAKGRSSDARPPSASELRSTLVVRFPIEEGSAKVRTGGPIEEENDLSLRIWAGQLPITMAVGDPLPDGGILPGVEAPDYATNYPSRRVLDPDPRVTPPPPPA